MSNSGSVPTGNSQPETEMNLLNKLLTFESRTIQNLLKPKFCI